MRPRPMRLRYRSFYKPDLYYELIHLYKPIQTMNANLYFFFFFFKIPTQSCRSSYSSAAAT
eukprot:scaffold652522_cov32-Prasinocladus_malaysianus.AAC.1